MAHLDAPQYTWVCQYCGHSSPGGTLYCASCGFPAHTSAFELERAKQLGSVQAFLTEHDARRESMITITQLRWSLAKPRVA
jgi:ribosomal protein L37E